MFGASPASAAQQIARDIITQFNPVVAGNFSTASDVESRLVANKITGGASFIRIKAICRVFRSLGAGR